MTADELSQLEFINRYTARHTPCHCAESEILVADENRGVASNICQDHKGKRHVHRDCG